MTDEAESILDPAIGIRRNFPERHGNPGNWKYTKKIIHNSNFTYTRTCVLHIAVTKIFMEVGYASSEVFIGAFIPIQYLLSHYQQVSNADISALMGTVLLILRERSLIHG